LQDGYWMVRWEAVMALHNIGDQSALESLISALNDPEPLVRKSAAEALGAIGDPAAIAALQQTLEDEDSGVAAAARAALEEPMPEADDEGMVS